MQGVGRVRVPQLAHGLGPIGSGEQPPSRIPSSPGFRRSRRSWSSTGGRLRRPRSGVRRSPPTTRLPRRRGSALPRTRRGPPGEDTRSPRSRRATRPRRRTRRGMRSRPARSPARVTRRASPTATRSPSGRKRVLGEPFGGDRRRVAAERGPGERSGREGQHCQQAERAQPRERERSESGRGQRLSASAREERQHEDRQEPRGSPPDWSSGSCRGSPRRATRRSPQRPRSAGPRNRGGRSSRLGRRTQARRGRKWARRQRTSSAATTTTTSPVASSNPNASAGVARIALGNAGRITFETKDVVP